MVAPNTITVEKALAWVGLTVAVVGGLFSLLVYGACGMSDAPDQSRHLIFLAFPLPSLALVLSLCSLSLASKRASNSPSRRPGVLALLIAAGSIALAFLFLRSYP